MNISAFGQFRFNLRDKRRNHADVAVPAVILLIDCFHKMNIFAVRPACKLLTEKPLQMAFYSLQESLLRHNPCDYAAHNL